MGLIAWRCIDSKDTIQGRLEDFYIQKLKFKKASEATKAHEFTYDDVRARLVEGRTERIHDSQDEDYGEEEYESEEDDPHHQDMMNLIERKNLQENSTIINWEDVKAVLEGLSNELPRIPAPPEVEQINPPD